MININLIKEFILSNFHKKPMILDNMETINKIADEKYSIARICDGEFFLMMEDQGFTFQSIDSSLTKRLFEVLNSDEEKMLVSIQTLEEEFDPNEMAFFEFIVKGNIKDALLRLKSAF